MLFLIKKFKISVFSFSFEVNSSPPPLTHSSHQNILFNQFLYLFFDNCSHTVFFCLCISVSVSFF